MITLYSKSIRFVRNDNTVCRSKTWKIFEIVPGLSARYLSKVFSMAESPCSTDHLGYSNFFHCLTHIQSRKNFVPWKNILSRAYYIKLKKKPIYEFNLKNEFLFTKLTLLIPNMHFFSPQNHWKKIFLVELILKICFL